MIRHRRNIYCVLSSLHVGLQLRIFFSFKSLTFFLGHTKVQAKRSLGFQQSDPNCLTFLIDIAIKNAGSGFLIACLIRQYHTSFPKYFTPRDAIPLSIVVAATEKSHPPCCTYLTTASCVSHQT